MQLVDVCVERERRKRTKGICISSHFTDGAAVAAVSLGAEQKVVEILTHQLGADA